MLGVGTARRGGRTIGARTWAEKVTTDTFPLRAGAVLCHFDAGHHNLLPQPGTEGDGRTVAVDWERIGITAVGEEIGLVVSSPFLRHELDPANLPLVQESVFEGYLAGLHSAGWRGDQRAVRLGFAANAALRFVVATPRSGRSSTRRDGCGRSVAGDAQWTS